MPVAGAVAANRGSEVVPYSLRQRKRPSTTHDALEPAVIRVNSGGGGWSPQVAGGTWKATQKVIFEGGYFPAWEQRQRYGLGCRPRVGRWGIAADQRVPTLEGRARPQAAPQRATQSQGACTDPTVQIGRASAPFFFCGTFQVCLGWHATIVRSGSIFLGSHATTMQRTAFVDDCMAPQ